MNSNQISGDPPFTGEGSDGAVPPLFSEDVSVITHAIRALVEGPNGPGPVDRSEEAQAIRTVTGRISALMDTDPAVLRQRLAVHAELANAMVLVYAQRAAAAPSPQSQAVYAGIALRAMATSGRLVALLGATAPQGGDGAALVALPADGDGDRDNA